MAVNFSPMKTFSQFLTEVYDKDVMGSSQIRRTGEGGRIRPKRKQTEPEKKRVKAVGGGKTEPAKTYKDRKDIGQPNPKRAPSGREQQPTQERGSAALSAKEAQRKAYRERKARESGAKTQTASELLTKKDKPKVDPKYKPAKASGLTRQERMKLHRKGETELRRTFKKQETDKYEKETGQKPDKKGRTTIGARVAKRMST